MCIHRNIYTYLYICIYIYVCVYIYMCIYVCMCLCVCVCVCVYVCLRNSAAYDHLEEPGFSSLKILLEQ